MNDVTHNALERVAQQVLPTICRSLDESEAVSATKVYPDYLEKHYQEFFDALGTRTGAEGVEQGIQAVVDEENEFWRGLRPGGIARCLFPTDEYIEFCRLSQKVFEQAALAHSSGVYLCNAGSYDQSRSAIEEKLHALSGAELDWAQDTAKQMFADLDYTYRKSRKMSFRLCRFLLTGTRKNMPYWYE